MPSFSETIQRHNYVQLTLDEAIDLVESNADRDWLKAALDQVRYLCQTRSEFTTDDVWQRLSTLDVATKEPRAMGAIMRDAAKRGWCESSDRFVKSKRPECHKRPIPVWRSRLYLPVCVTGSRA